MKGIDKEELNLISMTVILHAGNAKELIYDAVKASYNRDKELASKLIMDANKEITLAHKTQTGMLQQEAEGVEIPYSPLFVHAQDTLMTTKSELNIIKEIIKLYERMEDK